MSGFLQTTCLKPRYSLRYQLFVSFGLTTAIAIGVVVLVATLTAKSSGQSVKTEARELLRGQVIANTRASSEHTADILSKKFQNLEGVVSLVGEVTRDRLVGYPTVGGWQSDTYVPFFDTVSRRNVYPFVTDPLPPDWDIDVNVNENNHQEHVQGRWSWYANIYPLSTASATFRIQGACDPNETDPSERTYYENCTDANNDFTTGGVVRPTTSTQYLASKAADLAVFLKPIYETHADVKHAGVYFANSGAGGSLVYPSYHIDGRGSYVSGGCDWMRSINPNTGEQFATEEEISRCHPEGTIVPGREYNPLERQWCRDQTLNPNKVKIVGPYLDAFINDLWLLTVGKPVFDRMTGHFIACTLLDVSVAHISEILESIPFNNYTDIALVRWDDGTVVYSNQWNTSGTLDTIQVGDLDFCDDSTFHNLKNLVDFDKPWVASEVREKFRSNTYNNDGQLLAAYPIPDPPEDYDSSYRPDFIVVQAVGEEIYSLINELEAEIDDDVSTLYVWTIVIGIVGLTFVLLVVGFVSVYLTRPLNWMMMVCRRIVRHSSEKSDGSIYDAQEEMPLMRCTPRTEVTAIVLEFQSVVQGFSGEGPASVASPNIHAIFNRLNWQEDFGLAYLAQLYETPEAVDEQGSTERRLSFAASVASHHSSTTIMEMDDMSEDDTDVEGKGSIIVDMSPVARSDVRVSEERPPHSSVVVSSSLEPGAVNATATEQEQDVATLTHSETKISEKPTHLFSCAESTRENKGHITTDEIDDIGAGRFENELRASIKRNYILHSPLFWWIMGLIVVPVLLTMASICTIVTVKVSTVLPSWLEKAEVASEVLEVDHVAENALSHAAIAEEIFVQPIGDLHLLTRIAGWMLFNAVNLGETFTDITQGTEECKSFPDDFSCDFFLDPERAVCDCRWKDPHTMSCQEYQNWRNQQKTYFACQAQDADPETGNRVSSTFPAVDYSPSSTLWWSDTTEMPGHSNSSLVQGYTTVFDRTRVMSALAVAMVPLYNYLLGGFSPKHLGIFIGMENDGMLAGYSGCDHSYPHYSHFRSTPENGAAKINPRLCPLNKYGYDSRCRGWYDEGKRANGLHLTAPYVFAATKEVANSVTFPIVDPSSGIHVGQTLIDFLPTGLEHAVTQDHRHDTTGFVIIVTPESDALGGDTLSGPGYSLGADETSPPIQKLVMPCDEELSSNRIFFDEEVLPEMKKGISSETMFSRHAFTRHGEDVTCDDTREETLFIAYRPVTIRETYPLRPDDFARGVNTTNITMASLGYVVPIDDLTAPFAAIEGEVDDEINRSISILIGLIAATAAVVTVVLAMITISVVKPVTILLEFVTLINKQHSIYDIPPMQGGSREVNQVYASLAKLHKIVRFSNMAFFSGKMMSAYRLLMDALSLFRRADDKKATGIAANNLGNTLLAIRNQKLSTRTCFRVEGNCVQQQALEAYNEAVASSTDEYERILCDTETGDLKAKLAEQLANRHFNRGLFFLITADDACAESDFVERGRQDLLKAGELDAEVRNLWVETRQVQKNSVRYFERLLRRAYGLIGLIQKGIIDHASWNVGGILEEADSLLFVVWNVPCSPLFDSFTRIGRLQQLEGAAIQYALCRGSKKEAARMSTRMLVEDEYIGEVPFSAAASAFLTWFKEAPPSDGYRATEHAIRRDLRLMLRSSRISSDAAVGTNIVFFQDLANLDDSCRDVLISFVRKLAESCSDDDFVMLPSQGSSEQESMLSVQKKGDMSDTDWEQGCERRRIKDVNVDIRRAFHMVMETEETSENDTWIILTTDRERWDSAQCLLSDSHHYLLSQISQLNKARTGVIHIAIVSMNASGNMAAICGDFSRVSRESLYIDLHDDCGPEFLDDALADIASLVIGGGKKSCAIPLGITMEKF